jgi:hypothetical protein
MAALQVELGYMDPKGQGRWYSAARWTSTRIPQRRYIAGVKSIQQEQMDSDLAEKIVRFKLLRMMAIPEPQNRCPQSTIDAAHYAMRKLQIDIAEATAGMDDAEADEIRRSLRLPRASEV